MVGMWQVVASERWKTGGSEIHLEWLSGRLSHATNFLILNDNVLLQVNNAPFTNTFSSFNNTT